MHGGQRCRSADSASTSADAGVVSPSTMSDFNAKKLLRKVWARADADGSGELDADELKLVLQAMGQKNPECARTQQRAAAGTHL